MMQEPKAQKDDSKVLERVDVLDRPTPYDYGEGHNSQEAPYCDDEGYEK